MKKTSIEMTVGLFVIVGTALIIYSLVVFGGLKLFNNKHYSLFARFESVAGLKNGASIEISGVPVGKVGSISLDKEMQVALVRLDISQEIELDEDVIAAVKTSGLIGDKYISLLSGGSEEILIAGDTILQTESTLDIESLIGKFVFGNVNKEEEQ